MTDAPTTGNSLQFAISELVIVPAATTQTLGFNPGSLTFSSQPTGTTSGAQGTVITNTGNAAITLTSIALGGADPGDYSIASNNCPVSLGAGSACTVTVTFSPTATGTRSASVVFTDNATGSPQSVTLSGTGVTATRTLTFVPSSLSFSSQNTGTTSSPQSTVVTNTGNVAVTFTGITITGTNASSFGITSNTCPAGLPGLGPGASCAVGVAFSPVANGALSANVTFTDNATGSPQSVGLSGIGQTIGRTLTFAPSSLTFSSQPTGTTSGAQGTVITNTGNAAITITSIALGGANPGDYSIASNNCPVSLGAGSACTVTVTFSPTATGTRTASVVFTDNATGSPQSVTLSGTGATPTRTLTFVPSSLSFSSQNTGTTSSPQSTVVTNTGNVAVTLTSIGITGTNASSFSISSNNCPASLGPGAGCTVGVTFSPTANGSLSANLTFTDNATGSPQSVSLSGTGQTITRTLTFAPSSLTFSSQPTGTTSGAQGTVITNTGNAAITLTSIALGGANPGDYSIASNNCPVSLGAGSACTVTVTFSPTATGTRSASVVFTDNATGSPQTVTLSGTGAAPTRTLTFVPSSLSFSSQNTGTTSSPQSTVVTNTGNVAVTLTSIGITGTNASSFAISSNNCPASPATLGPGAGCTVGVTFSPTANGSLSANLTFTDNATGSPQSVSLSGTGQTITRTLTANPTSLPFAAQNQGSTSSPLSTSITNTGNSAVTITAVTITGTNASDFAIFSDTCPVSPSTLAAGSNCSIEVTFTPSSTGTRSASLSITSNATGSPLVVPLSGTGQAVTRILTFNPVSQSLNFGTVDTPSSSSPMSVTVTSSGTAAVTFTSIGLTGTDASDYAITSNSCPSSPASLAVGNACVVQVTFTPTTNGTLTANLVFTDNATGSPQTVSLTGIGVVTARTLTANPTSLTFSSQNEHTTSPAQGTTITNTGNAAVTFSGFTITGTNASDFAIASNNCPSSPATLAATSSCQITVTFTPSGAGTRTASLSIASNATGSPLLVGLSGTGTIPNQTLSFSTLTVNFGTWTDGDTSSPQGVGITNTGTAAVTFTSFTLSGTNASEFTITSNSCPVSPATLAAGNSCSVTLAFIPPSSTPYTTGLQTANLVVASNATGSPQGITLNGTAQAPATTITVSPATTTFSTINVGTLSTQRGITISNTGTSSVLFNGFAITGTNASDFAISENTCPVPPATLPAGQSCTVYISFTPAAAGTRTASLVITDNAVGTPHTVGLSGTGQAVNQILTFSPTSVTFPTQNVGTTSSTRTLNISSATGTAAVTISSITITGTNAADFSVVGNTCPLSPQTLNLTSCNVTLTFTPSISGTENANVTVVSNGTGSPQSVPVSGVGQGNTPGPLNFSLITVGFGTETVGTTTGQTGFYITNTGTQTVTFSSFTFGGSNPSDFAFGSSNSTSGCGSSTTLTAGSECYVYLTFTPSVVGARSATITVTSNATNSPTVINLSGTGSATLQLTVAPTTLTFPAQNQGTTSSPFPVTVYNTSSSAITLSSFMLGGTNSGDFAISANACPSSLAAGANCAVTLTFTPSATGARTATLSIASSASGSPAVVTLNGTGQSTTQTLQISTTQLTFATQNVNTTSSAQSISLHNNGTGAITFGGIAVGGTNASDFAITQNTCPVAPAQLASGGSCYVYVAFTPTATGVRTAALTINSSAAGSPYAVTLNGTGQALTTNLQLSYTSMSFSPLVVGTSSSANYEQLTNNGTTPITFSSIAITGTNASDFTISESSCPISPATLAAGATCYVYIVFTPSAVGQRTAALVITSNAPGSPQSVPLSGVGRSSNETLSFNYSQINFGSQLINTTSSNNYFYIYNVGTAPVTFTAFTLTGTNAGDFAIYGNNCPVAPQSLAAGTSCYVYINFTPSAVGLRTAAIQITSSAPSSPDTVSFSGLGTTADQILNEQYTEISFGNVVVGNTTGATANYFYLYNNGTQAITISAISIIGANSGDFTIPSGTCPIAPATLAPNGSCYEYVTFTPSAVGPRTASVQITSSAPSSPNIVTLNGNGETSYLSINIQYTGIAFGNVNVGTTTGATANYFYIYNTGIQPVTITGFTIGGADPGDFAIASSTCPISPNTLAAGGSCYAYVTFTPSAIGSRTATITIGNNTSSPNVVSLSGIGQSPTLQLTFQPANLVFAPEAVGTTSSAQYTYAYSEGTSPVTISSVTITGTNASDFAITSDTCPISPSTLSGNCYVYVTFTPSAAGDRVAALTFTTNAPNSPQTVPLTGRGSAAEGILYSTTSAINFTTPENVGTTSGDAGVNVYDEGSASVTFSTISITGTNASDFSIASNSCPLTLTVSAGCTVYVTFTPTAIGPRTATLTFANNTSVNPFTVTLNGIGQAATMNTLELSASSLTFSTPVVVNTTSSDEGTNIYNEGTAAITISGITITGTNASDFGIVSDNCGTTLNPSGGCTVYVAFTPSAIGARSASLQITSSAAGSPQTVSLFGTGEAATQSFDASSSSITFSSTNVGATSSQAGDNIYNEGTTAMTLTSFSIVGTNAGDFSIVSNNCPSSLNPTAGCTFYVTFRPSAIGLRTAQVQIVDSAPGSPHLINLSGTGQSVFNTLMLSYTTLSFGLQIEDTPSSQSGVSLYNEGDSPLTLSSFTIGGTNASDFSISNNNCPSSLGAGGGCTVDIVFQPGAVGPRSATLTIVSNAPDSPTVVQLTGEGEAITHFLEFVYSSYTFSAQNLSTTSSQAALSMYNEGDSPVTFSGFSIVGTNSTDFAISSNNCPSTLNPGAGCTVYITFTPSAAGARSAQLKVTSNDPNSPALISLFGTGQAATQILTLEYSELNFSSVTTGTSSSAENFYIQNNGNSTITLNSFTLGGTNPGDFSITQNQCSSTLTAGSYCYVYVEFTPAAAGQRAATISIATSAPNSPSVISLFGIGQ